MRISFFLLNALALVAAFMQEGARRNSDISKRSVTAADRGFSRDRQEEFRRGFGQATAVYAATLAVRKTRREWLSWVDSGRSLAARN